MRSQLAVRCLARFLSISMLLLLASATAGAQSLFGTISGTVVDQQGGALPGADVTLTDQQSKAVQHTNTNQDGVFVFAAVQAGTYSGQSRARRASTPGRQPTSRFASVSGASLPGIKMQLGALSESVSVTARPEIAPIDSGEKSARLTSEQIQNVPMVGRSTAELLKLLPGMTPISGGTSNSPGFNGEIIGINGNGDGGKQSAVGNFSGNGTRADALDIVIDGAHASDPGCNCATSVNPNPDMVGEFKVLQANYGAEHAKGPITIDVVSKAGGRDFRGIGYVYMRDYRLNSNEWLLNKISTEPGAGEQAEEQVHVSRLQHRRPAAHPGHGFQQEPRQGVLLHRLRVLPTEARHRARCSPGCRPRRCATATSATPRTFSDSGQRATSARYQPTW